MYSYIDYHNIFLKTNKCHQSSSEEFLQFFIFHSQSVHFLLDLVYPGGLLKQYSSLLLMTLKLPAQGGKYVYLVSC